MASGIIKYVKNANANTNTDLSHVAPNSRLEVNSSDAGCSETKGSAGQQKYILY